MEELEYLYTYKGHDIFQDTENGYFTAFDPNGQLISNKATQEMIKKAIDSKLDETIKP